MKKEIRKCSILFIAIISLLAPASASGNYLRVLHDFMELIVKAPVGIVLAVPTIAGAVRLQKALGTIDPETCHSELTSHCIKWELGELNSKQTEKNKN